MPVVSAATVAAAAYTAGFRGKDVQTATAVAFGESSYNTEAKNSVGAGHYGLWQISALHFDPSKTDWKDPVTNAKLAKGVFDKQGWNAWTVYTSGAYRLHLSKASKGMKDAGIDSGGTKVAEGFDWTDLLGGPVSVSKDVAEVTGKSLLPDFSFFTDPNNWRRFGYIVVGGITVMIGIVMVIRGQTAGQAVSTVTATATKVVKGAVK